MTLEKVPLIGLAQISGAQEGCKPNANVFAHYLWCSIHKDAISETISSTNIDHNLNFAYHFLFTGRNAVKCRNHKFVKLYSKLFLSRNWLINSLGSRSMACWLVASSCYTLTKRKTCWKMCRLELVYSAEIAWEEFRDRLTQHLSHCLCLTLQEDLAVDELHHLCSSSGLRCIQQKF